MKGKQVESTTPDNGALRFVEKRETVDGHERLSHILEQYSQKDDVWVEVPFVTG